MVDAFVETPATIEVTITSSLAAGVGSGVASGVASGVTVAVGVLFVSNSGTFPHDDNPAPAFPTDLDPSLSTNPDHLLFHE